MILANVIIIDDDAFVRTMLAAGFKSYGINVIASGENFLEVSNSARNIHIDVGIVDLDLGPGPSGIDICYNLRKKQSDIGLILLTSYTDPKIANPNLPKLPKGTRFLSKSQLSDFQVLVNSVLSAKVKPLEGLRNQQSQILLTNTQIEVLKMVAEGLSTSEIAIRRGVSNKAIEGIISKLHQILKLEKTQKFNQRVQLARAYFKLSGRKAPGDQ